MGPQKIRQCLPNRAWELGGTVWWKSFEFENTQFAKILSDFNSFKISYITSGRGHSVLPDCFSNPFDCYCKWSHVLTSNIYSKSILRDYRSTCSQSRYIEYFPSYEIVTNPRMYSSAFADNLRSVRNEAIEIVIGHSFAEHIPENADVGEACAQAPVKTLEDSQCEEALMEAFGQ